MKEGDIKIEVMSHYSGYNPPRCGKCGKTDLTDLTIDHVFNDGAIMRKMFPYQKRHLYRWLKNRGYPSGFQVLCKKCNEEKRRELKLYSAGDIKPISRTDLENYIKKYNKDWTIEGDFCIIDSEKIPIENLVLGNLKFPDPLKVLLASGKWKANHLSLIEEDSKKEGKTSGGADKSTPLRKNHATSNNARK
jgi:hypothetical protein